MWFCGDTTYTYTVLFVGCRMALCNIAISDTNYEAVKITDIFLSALFQPGRREEGRGQRALQDEELQGRAAAILGGHQ